MFRYTYFNARSADELRTMPNMADTIFDARDIRKRLKHNALASGSEDPNISTVSSGPRSNPMVVLPPDDPTTLNFTPAAGPKIYRYSFLSEPVNAVKVSPSRQRRRRHAAQEFANLFTFKAKPSKPGCASQLPTPPITPPSQRHSRSSSPKRKDYTVAVSQQKKLIEKAKCARLYLLHQTGPGSFLVVGDVPTEHRFRVVLSTKPSCSCGRLGCLHLLFVLLRVFRLKEDDPKLFAKYLLNYEVEHMIEAYQNMRELRLSRIKSSALLHNQSFTDHTTNHAESHQSNASKLPLSVHTRHASLSETDLRRAGNSAKSVVDGCLSASTTDVSSASSHSSPLSTCGSDTSLNGEEEEHDVCPICLLDMTSGESLVSCINGCHNKLHYHCISIWAQELQSSKERLHCPLCRTPWKDFSISSPLSTHQWRPHSEASPPINSSSHTHPCSLEISSGEDSASSPQSPESCDEDDIGSPDVPSLDHLMTRLSLEEKGEVAELLGTDVITSAFTTRNATLQKMALQVLRNAIAPPSGWAQSSTRLAHAALVVYEHLIARWQTPMEIFNECLVDISGLIRQCGATVSPALANCLRAITSRAFLRAPLHSGGSTSEGTDPGPDTPTPRSTLLSLAGCNKEALKVILSHSTQILTHHINYNDLTLDGGVDEDSCLLTFISDILKLNPPCIDVSHSTQVPLDKPVLSTLDSDWLRENLCQLISVLLMSVTNLNHLTPSNAEERNRCQLDSIFQANQNLSAKQKKKVIHDFLVQICTDCVYSEPVFSLIQAHIQAVDPKSRYLRKLRVFHSQAEKVRRLSRILTTSRVSFVNLHSTANTPPISSLGSNHSPEYSGSDTTASSGVDCTLGMELTEFSGESDMEKSSELNGFLDSSEYREGVEWRKGRVLGSGSFASCFLAKDCLSGRLMVLKRISILRNDEEAEDEGEKVCREEVRILAALRDHPNVVKMYSASTITESSSYCDIFLEWMPGGSLSSYLRTFGALEDVPMRRLLKQLFDTLAYVHAHGFIHRDIKGENLLLNSTAEVIKMADFGTAASLKLAPKTTKGEFEGQLKGTIVFMAPEVVRGEDYGRSCDVWSMGCVMIEMATAQLPWGASYSMNQYPLVYKIGSAVEPPPFPDSVCSDWCDLALKCLNLQPSLRSPASQLTQHAYLTSAV